MSGGSSSFFFFAFTIELGSFIISIFASYLILHVTHELNQFINVLNMTLVLNVASKAKPSFHSQLERRPIVAQRILSRNLT